MTKFIKTEDGLYINMDHLTGLKVEENNMGEWEVLAFISINDEDNFGWIIDALPTRLEAEEFLEGLLMPMTINN
jgi:hypothetical protein